MLTTDIPCFLASLFCYTVKHITQATSQLTVYRFLQLCWGTLTYLYSPFGPLCLHLGPFGVLIQDLLWFIFSRTSGWHKSRLLQTRLVTWKTAAEGGISQHDTWRKTRVTCGSVSLFVLTKGRISTLRTDSFISIYPGPDHRGRREAQIILSPILILWDNTQAFQSRMRNAIPPVYPRPINRHLLPEGHDWNNHPGSCPAAHSMEE